MAPPRTTAPSSPFTAIAVGDPFGDSYELIRELGRGGMAIVYLMRERATGEERAVKVVHTKFVDDEEALARFDREARLVAQLKHPNIVATHSVQWIEGVGFGLVMDRVPGRTLKQILNDGTPLPFDRAQVILDDVAAALGHAHEHGIVHRDVKPENIFVNDGSGRALLADFGIARSVQSETQLTVAGAAIGTPTYMAPEQIDGRGIDARSDLYSLGLVGWEMLTGRRPWDGETLYNVIYRQKHDELAAIDALRPETPPHIVCAIEGLLEKSPANRWQTADQFRAELASADPIAHRKRRTKVAAPDSTIAIPIPATRTVRSRLRRFAPAGAAVGLLLSATLLFARPAPSWAPRIGGNSTKALSNPPAKRPAALPAIHSPANNYGAAVVPGAAISNVDSAGTSLPVVPAIIDNADPQAASVTSNSALSAETTTVGTPARDILTPVAPTAAAIVATHSTGRFSIAAGGAHTCMIDSLGATYCWGANGAGQLGTGATETSTTPTRVAGTEHFSSVAPGLSHTCAVTQRGALFCWGNNGSGQLADGTHTSRDVPTRVALARSLASVASGAGYSCGLTDDGQAYCWGANGHGQVGDGTTNERTTPTRVAGRIAFTTLVTGWNHACGLSKSGLAYCWGANNAGQLGDGTNTDHSTPTLVLSTANFTRLSAGNAHTCATTTSGTLYCWGDNRYGQLGDGTESPRSMPVAVSSSQRFISVSAGSVHTCALSRDNSAWCWGRNTYGQLGDGSATTQTIPVRVSGGHHFTSVKAFGAHTCGTTMSNEIFCWGYNLDGELGDGTRDHRLRPTYIEKPGA
jgi:serine/threonine protein kinase/alpha-tubulin suppressor-like RCC1 family protein